MVDTYNRSACLFQKPFGVVATQKMKPRRWTNTRLQVRGAQHQNRVSSAHQRGWKSRNLSTSGRGRKIFLDIPFIELPINSQSCPARLLVGRYKSTPIIPRKLNPITTTTTRNAMQERTLFHKPRGPLRMSVRPSRAKIGALITASSASQKSAGLAGITQCFTSASLMALIANPAAKTHSRPGENDFTRSELLPTRDKPITPHAIAPRMMPNSSLPSVSWEPGWVASPSPPINGNAKLRNSRKPAVANGAGLSLLNSGLMSMRLNGMFAPWCRLPRPSSYKHAIRPTILPCPICWCKGDFELGNCGSSE